MEGQPEPAPGGGAPLLWVHLPLLPREGVSAVALPSFPLHVLRSSRSKLCFFLLFESFLSVRFFFLSVFSLRQVPKAPFFRG